MCFSVNKRRYNSIQRNIPCAFCRDAGKKCIWVETVGGPRICQRCHKKGINCSGPTRRPPTGAFPVPQQRHFLLHDEEHLAVAAPPFHHIIGDHSADYSLASGIAISTSFQAPVPVWGHYDAQSTSPSFSTASGSGFSSPVDVNFDNSWFPQCPYPYMCPRAASNPFQTFFPEHRDWSLDNLNSAVDESSLTQFSSLSNAEGVYQAAYSAVRVDAGGTEDHEFEAWSNGDYALGDTNF